MDESPFHSSNPETSIAIPEESIRIDIMILENPIGIDCGPKWVGFDFVADELHESRCVHRD
jgi:hypothetical protein